MKSFLFTSATILATVVTLSIAPAWEVSAEEIISPMETKEAERKILRNIAPNKARLIRTNPQFKAKGSGGTAVVCCTHWNSSTGGTGCATYPDSCPDDTFTVECDKDGCW